MNEREFDEVEIDLLEILDVLMANIVLLVVATVIAGVLAFGYTKIFLRPQYESVTSVYIMNKRSGSDELTTNDTTVASQLTKDYAKLITDRTVLEKVIGTSQLEKETYESLKGRVTVTNATDTRILEIKVRDRDPEIAQELANTIREVAATHIKEVTAVEAVNLVDTANLPKSPCSPNAKKNTLLGAVVGFCLAAAFVVLRFLLDTTIKTLADVEKYLQLSTLAMIPNEEQKSGSKKKKTKKKKKRNPNRFQNRKKVSG